MNAINRQKFLAELAKLLTFMYEEDRQYALSMYERMFDVAGDEEQLLLQHLVSPTKQAVIIARAYKSKERKLSVEAQYKEADYEDGEGTPPFVLAINDVFNELLPKEEDLEEPAAEEEEDEQQLTFVELDLMPKEPEPKKPKLPDAAVLLDNTQEFSLKLDALQEAETEDTSLFPDGKRPFQEEDIFVRLREVDTAGTSDRSTVQTESAVHVSNDEAARTETPEDVGTAAARPTETSDGRKAPSEQDDGKTSIASMLGLDHEPAQEPIRAEEKTGDPIAQTVSKETKVSDAEKPKTEDRPHGLQPDRTEPAETETGKTAKTEHSRKKKVRPDAANLPKPAKGKDRTHHHEGRREMQTPRLVLFLIAAIPVTLALLALLAVPMVICIAVAVGLCALGATLIVSAFSGFAVLADILLLLGASIVALALGLLFLWIAIWLIGSEMFGLVTAVKDLAEKWCSKEVPAE